jgi:glutamate synthase domain-containing protein 1
MTTAAEKSYLQEQGLYSAEHEHDSCGVGFVAHIKGEKSHAIVTQGLKILENLDHRGAVGADKLMGDGAGILIQMPDALYREEMAKAGVELPPPGEYGVGMIFLPKEHASRLACEQELERAIKAEGQVLIGWRDVPVDREMPMSPAVRQKEPVIRQVFIGRGTDVIVQDALERKLYVIRKTASAAIQNLRLKHSKEYYVPSMSSRTVVYKGLLLADQVGQYYMDLKDPRCVSALALVHQRFSTNTFPEWPLAHPYRYVAHNGEINTAGARRRDVLARARRRPEEAVSHQLPKPVGHRHLRQLPGAAVDGRLPAGAGGDDDDPRAVGAAHADGRAPQGVLRVPRGDAGAVGRPGVDRVHGRPPDRRHAGPQWPASLALLRDG